MKVELGCEAFFDFYYTSFHFVVPLTILGVLYVRRPADYRWARASLGLRHAPRARSASGSTRWPRRA